MAYDKKRFSNTESKMIYQIMDEFDKEAGRDIGNDPLKRQIFLMKQRTARNRQQFINESKAKSKYEHN